jgi:predicted MPP superfamily phosphohydrolase
MSAPRSQAVRDWLIVLLIALLAMFAAVTLFSAVEYDIAAFRFIVELVPFQKGDTVIIFPPVGEVRAGTHVAPFQLKITLKNVDLEILSTSIDDLSNNSNINYFEQEIREKLYSFLIRIVAKTFLLGSAAVFFIGRQGRLSRVLAGGLTSALFFLGLFFLTVALPYNLEAFSNPQYHGALSAAPRIINFLDDTMAVVKNLGRQLELMTENIHTLAEQIEHAHPYVPGSELRVLHVSDIHNNPAAFDFIERVVDSFAIDLIIDTGDITDYGTPLELELIARVDSLPVPYLFVPGNHDSPRVIEVMEREGAIVLQNNLVELNGLTILGIADPASRDQSVQVAPEAQLRNAAATAIENLLASEPFPDILAVHHPLIGQLFKEKIPFILHGHTHRAQVSLDGPGALIDAGSSGAAGIRGLESPRDNPYSMVILYFSTGGADRPELVMADLITVQQLQNEFALQRYYNPANSRLVQDKEIKGS